VVVVAVAAAADAVFPQVAEDLVAPAATAVQPEMFN
jgi:hypothetical protein